MEDKSTGKWRIFVDFRYMKHACPNDCNSLLQIDLLIEVTYGHEFQSFIDAYYGYNQIKMSEKDLPHTTFYEHSNIYYYKVIPLAH